MTIEAIRDIAINSCEAYYEYLEQNDKGVQEIDVFELEYVNKTNIINLRLSAKIFDVESIFFKILISNEKYDTSDIKIIEYDYDKNIVLIKPSEEIINIFQTIQAKDIKVISDLKFLIERVKYWYESNGSKISLPVKISKHSRDLQKILDFKDEELLPSESQKQSLKNIFTSPFSYIWGAPGTGKTQFVLSYAVLHYIHKNDKVAILAPTNNAIEQVLTGLIKMTDKAGVDRKQIIRLGTPSKKFAENFSEVCEEKGIQKRLEEIDKQIDILQRMLKFQTQRDLINKINTIMPEFDQLNELANNLQYEQNNISAIQIKFKKKEIDIKILNEELVNIHERLKKNLLKTNSISHKVIKLFYNNTTNTEKTIEILENKILNLKKEIEFSKYEISEIIRIKNTHEDNIKKIQNSFFNKARYLVTSANGFSEVKTLFSKLLPENVNEIKHLVQSVITQKNEMLNLDAYLFNEYNTNKSIDVENELNTYLSLREKLATLSTEERLKSVNVIACTLDGYIGRYSENQLDVEHVFLDEAGYANVIKAMTLFNINTPISFLGDHKQLPPVCEINDNEIEKDHKFFNMFLWAQSAIFLDNLFLYPKEVCRNQYLKNLDFDPKKISKTSLTSTYRFGNNLAKILAKYVYENNFTSSNPQGETQILYVNAKKIENYRSRISMNEVVEIKKIVDKLKTNGKNDFVILTPYKKQIKLLNTYLPQERNDLRILTVHGSQGKEWKTVILSIVDTSDKWFVDSTIPTSKGLNLINTAVSRAKENLIIVCDTQYWIEQQNQLITELLHCGEELNHEYTQII